MFLLCDIREDDPELVLVEQAFQAFLNVEKLYKLHKKNFFLKNHLTETGTFKNLV